MLILYVKLNNKYIKMKNKPSIVLGTWSWGTGVVGGDQVFGNHLGEKELRPVFEEAMKNGLNLWDSAVVYGMGASETLLSSFTREYPRNEVLVSTKFTPQIADEKAENPVAEMLEGSLSRFSTNYIDIYWIHNHKWLKDFNDLLFNELLVYSKFF